jgi:drug/metabolite transporter (DMT)-like permease
VRAGEDEVGDGRRRVPVHAGDDVAVGLEGEGDAGVAVLANIAPYLLFSWSEQRINSGLAGVPSGTTPLLTLLLARAFGVGRLTPPRVLGLALGLAGVVLLAAPWYDGSRAVSLTGVLAALGCSRVLWRLICIRTAAAHQSGH